MAKDTTPVKSEPQPIPADLPPEIPPTKWDWVVNHLRVHRPTYVWLPVTLLFIWAMFHAYTALTGRQPVDEMPVGALGNIILTAIVLIFANLAKPRLFDDIDTKVKDTPWWRIVIDSAETCFLLLLLYFMVFKG